MSGILIVAETWKSAIRPEFRELVTAASQIQASGGGDIRVCTIVAPGADIPSELSAFGSGEVHALEVEGPDGPWPEAHAEALAQLCGDVKPHIVLLAPTLLGQEVAARLAALRKAVFIQGATHVETDGDGLRARRPIHGGAATASLTASAGPFVIVPKSGAYDSANPSGSPSPASDVIRHPVAPRAEPRTHLTGFTRQDATVANIKAAKVLVSGGRGIGGPEGFGLLQEVADLAGGVVSASRPPCDAGWVDRALQVGLTGKTVAPDLYLAVGISGAIQHLMGCVSAKMIVAVNNDEGAPIFSASTLGVVGDWEEVMTGLRDALQELVNG